MGRKPLVGKARPARTEKDYIAWRICTFAAGYTGECACQRRGHGHCEAAGKVAGEVFNRALWDLQKRGYAKPEASQDGIARTALAASTEGRDGQA